MNFFEWLWAHPIYFLWIYLFLMTVICFSAMGIDKSKAVKERRRIAESTLFLLAIFGGSIGGILGMRVFRHKTLHKKFIIGFPLILLLQIALAVFVYIRIRGGV